MLFISIIFGSLGVFLALLAGVCFGKVVDTSTSTPDSAHRGESKSNSERGGFVFFLGLVCITVSLTFCRLDGSYAGKGQLGMPGNKLNTGDTYVLLAERIRVSKEESGEKEDYFIVPLKINNKEIYVFRLNRSIPKKGMVVEKDGKLVFLALPESAEEKATETAPAVPAFTSPSFKK